MKKLFLLLTLPFALQAQNFKLDVRDPGDVGIKLKSTTAGVSMIDIDAHSGNAGLRFLSNGSYKWMLRNEPSTNRFEFYDLAFGPRITIQNNTGNVGIGESFPGYKLQVVHGGANGILNKSTSSSSVLDIDAFNGDASVRFLANGSFKWLVRNEPTTNRLEFYDTSFGPSMTIANGTGNVGISQSSPAYKLDVNGIINAAQFLVNGVPLAPGFNPVYSYSSPWFTSPSNSVDTTMDGTCYRSRRLPVPELTQAMRDGASVTVYMRVGSIGPYLLPYISDAGGATNQIHYTLKKPGEIVVFRHTFNTCRFNSGIAEQYPGQPVLVNLPQSLEYRYVITK
jgi:hypothetical protein